MGFRLLCLSAAAALPAPAAEAPEGFRYFEEHIRPLLAEKCYSCHSADAATLGGLRLDSKEGLLRGGSRGAAIQPGNPDASLLVQAISYQSLALRMPPTGALSDAEVDRVREWVRMGAPDPRAGAAQLQPQESVDLDEGRRFWSFRPVGRPVPAIDAEDSWSRTAADRFALARMAGEGLAPAGEADRPTLLRRLAFDLTGLPPSPEEIRAFAEDRSPDALERVVDRLLASPHYGERWGRHWLDLVRWAETNGHEFDNDKLDAWRYRDYVIDSFNSDLPYDLFLREQVAGDLLPPRLSADGTHYVSPVASGMHWLWEVLNSPTDSVKARADQVNNQLDVVSKAALGLTVACARCHDHKFDPIPTADYYSLFGILHSTHMIETCVDSPDRQREIAAAGERIGSLNDEIAELLRPAKARRAATLAGRLTTAAAETGGEGQSALAAELEYAATEPSHPLHPFSTTAQRVREGAGFDEAMARIRDEMSEWDAKSDPGHDLWTERGDEVYEDFEAGFGRWTVSGAAFAGGPASRLPPSHPVGGHAGQALAASHGAGADAFVGTLTTPKFRMPAKFVHVRMAGDAGSARRKERQPLRVTVIADEHKSGHAAPSGKRLRWHTIAMTKERGRICAIEIVDRDREGSLAVDRIVFSSDREPPPVAGPISPGILALVHDEAIRSLDDFALAYQRLAADLAGDRNPSAEDAALLAAIVGPQPLEDAREALDPAASDRLEALSLRRAEAGRSVPPSAFALASRDWQPADSPIHVRGNHENPGAVVPRQFLQVIAGSDQEPVRNGSGRLELARWLASEANPLTPRVMANRIWHHHFGRGLVPSTDDFGRMGAEPSHPDLLDHLARSFVESGWSVKNLHRSIVLSAAYRMRSGASERAAERDPDNRLLSHFPVRRLEAEAIRDSVLAVAGSLDPSVGGPSVPPHISEYQAGRGKPESGPLDGMGRRSVYTQVRRNFLPPLFLAFDYPLPISTEGRRGVSAVSSQALLMLNNEFVAGQAGLWADGLAQAHPQVRERIRAMYLQAFARPPAGAEVDEIERFLEARSETDGPDAWADLAHALLNTAEFLFVR